MLLKHSSLKSILVTLTLCYCFTVIAQSQLTRNQLNGGINTITTAVPFLLIAPESRGGGLGEAGAASTPDAYSMHWNPAKLAFIDKKIGLSVSYTPWLRALVPDINLAYLTGYYKLDKDKAIGASLRYFSLGDITFTDVIGTPIGQFRPNEFALDFGYAQKLGKQFSVGMAARYIYSNLTGGVTVGGAQTKPGQSFAVDISTFYQNSDIKIGDKKSILGVGLNISNVGAKISYSETAKRDFLPMNMRLGTSLLMKLDDYNTISFLFDLNKLLVPSPPIYKTDSQNQPIRDADGNYVIAYGQDPNRGVAAGLFGSFNDAPGGFNEELREINMCGGVEYWYDKQFAVRVGYFNEDATKGNRKFFTLGAGIKYNVFGLDFAYLIPTTQRNPLENTLRFSLFFDFDAFKEQNKEEKAE